MTIPAEKVLITGASGYIATHIINLLFSQGYEIIGTVRTPSKGDWLAAKFPGFKYEIVEDLLDSAAFARVFQAHPDVKYVLHTANPMAPTSADFLKCIVDPAVQGTESVLKAAHEHGNHVKRFVLTSSMVATFPRFGFNHPDLTVTEDQWSPVTYEQGANSFIEAYVASKKFGEKAAWDFQEKYHPGFSIAAILAPLAYGPPINEATYATLSSSSAFIKKLMDLPLDATELPNFFIGQGDVRDIARTHVAALQNAEFDNGRWMPLATLANDQLILDIIHKHRPDQAKEILTKGVPGSFKVEEYYKYDNSKTKTALGFEFIDFEKTIIDHFDATLALRAKEEQAQ